LATYFRLRQYILKGPGKQRSTQQTSRRLEEHYPDDETMRVSAETIYTCLHVLPRGELRQELPGCHASTTRSAIHAVEARTVVTKFPK
jgi:IS30 family transposase